MPASTGSPPPRQSDRRRRSRRAARPRSSRSWSRTRSTPARRRIAIADRARRQEADARRRRRRGDGRRGCAAGDRAARDEQDRAAPDDLGAIRTLGFRGEALPSIASVSHFMLRTRARGQRDRHRDPRQRRRRSRRSARSARPRARRIEVADLFYNLPARRKFLKSDTAEAAQISRLVTQMALGYPEVGFTLDAAAGRAALLAVPAGERTCASGSSSCSASAPT